MGPYGSYSNNYNYGTAQPVQVQQQASGNLLTVLVNSETDVDLYPVAPNTTVMLINFESGKFWLKSRGMNGVPQPIRVFTFTESAPVANSGDIVTRKEFSELNSKLDRLIAELGGGDAK